MNAAGYTLATRIFSLALIAIGVAMMVRALVLGGSPLAIGVILGLMFVIIGAGRMYFTGMGRRR